MPELIVMMPAYNAEKTIGRAIASTLAAMPADAALVVWDDASSDNTCAVADGVADPRLRLMTSKVNAGSGVARSKILEATDSRVVACMDADDVCLPWRFRIQRNMLRHADFCFGAEVAFRLRPFHLRPTMPIGLSPRSSGVALLIHNPFAQSTFTASRAALVKAGGYSNLRLGQDYELWLRSASSGVRLAKTAIPLALYRHSEGQVTGQPGYRQAVRTNPAIRAAYLSLLAHQSARLPQRDLPDDPSPAGSGGAGISDVIRSRVDTTMSGYARRYYHQVCAANRRIRIID